MSRRLLSGRPLGGRRLDDPRAASPTSKAITWVPFGGTLATLDIDFVNDIAYNSPFSVTIPSLLTCTRATPAAAYYTKADRTLTTFAANTLRYGSNGLLVEEARTNLILQSQTFDNASWTKTDTTATANNIAAPDGTTTADLLTEGAAGTAVVLQAVTATADANYSVSRYVKRGNHQWYRFTVLNGANSFSGWYDLTNGVVGSTAAAGTGVAAGISIETLADSWFRCKLVGSVGSAATAITFQSFSTSADAGSTRVSGATRYEWGAQFEDAATFATSYILTTTVAVTRASEVVTSVNVTWLTQGTGTFYVQANTFSNVGQGGIFSLNDGTANNRIDARGVAGNALLSTGGVGIATLAFGQIPVGTTSKLAIAYAVNDMAAVKDAGAAVTDATGTPMAVATQLQIGLLDGAAAGADGHSGYIRRFAYWNTRLANGALQTMTT